MCCHTRMQCRRHRTWHPTHHSIQTRGWPVAVLFIDVEHHTMEYTATHFNVLGQTQPWNPSLTHTPANAHLYDAVMVVVSRKLARKYHTNRVLILGPVVCESITLSTRPQLLPLPFRSKSQSYQWHSKFSPLKQPRPPCTRLEAVGEKMGMLNLYNSIL